MAQRSLLELNPDYVLEVLQTVDPATDRPTEEATADLQRLLATLDAKNFYIEIRPGTVNNLLVFVKLNDLDLARAVEEARINDWKFGINSDILTAGADASTLTNAEKLRIVNQILITPQEVGGCGLTPKTDNWNFVRSIVPVLHYSELKSKFKQTKFDVTAFNDEANAANVEFVLQNFGTKFAFYHYFINFYNNWLLQIALFGVAANFVFARYSLVFTYASLAWAVAFYLYWKFTQLKLAKKWGVSKNVEQADPPKSSANLDEPAYKRLARELSFVPTAALFVAVLLTCQFICFFVEIFLTEIYDGWLKPYLGLAPTVLLTLLVTIVTQVYTKFLTRHLEWENHARYSTQNYSKIIKTFVFAFLTSYIALFITSFLYLPFGFKVNGLLPSLDTKLNSYVNITVKKENYAVNEARLNGQFQFFILINQVVGLVLEFVLPVVLGKIMGSGVVKSLTGAKDEIQIEYNDAEPEKEYLSDIRAVLARPDYDIDEEFKQLVLQFGYLVMFGPIWSLGPFISLVVNLIQQKFDFLKLFSSVKTPAPSRASSIFPWDDFLKLLLYIGSATSVAVAVMYHGDIVSSTSRSAVGIRWWKIIGPALITEHVVILVVQTGEKVIEYYADYLTSQETNLEEDSAVRAKYLDSVYTKKVVAGGSGKSLNNISALVGVAALAPATLIKAKQIAPKLKEKASVEKDLSAIDKKIESASAEKQRLDQLYEEKNGAIKATESQHAAKLDGLAAASAGIDDQSKDLIAQKSEILGQLEAESGPKLSELEQLKAQKAQLEDLKAEKLAGVGGSTTAAAGTDSGLVAAAKNAVPETVAAKAGAAVAGATVAATTVAAAAQSKLVDLQGKTSTSGNTATAAPGATATGAVPQTFDLQEGDRIISSKQHKGSEVTPVIATIDNNEHFQPEGLKDVEIVDGGSFTPENGSSSATAADSSSTPSKTASSPKKSKSPLKTFIKKINS